MDKMGSQGRDKTMNGLLLMLVAIGYSVILARW